MLYIDIFCPPFSGDRILAVNGKSLEYVSHDEAVQALKNTPVNVELLVSQSMRTDGDVGKKHLQVSRIDKEDVYLRVCFKSTR
jgi:C-terminal processing protease CtpA/Prc